MADPYGSPEHRDYRRRRITPGDTSQVTLVRDERNPLRWGWWVAGGMSLLVLLLSAAAAAVLILTNTDWGRERVRRYAQDFINARIHGRARIGRLSGNLLVGATVHDFSITDSTGAPFIAIETFSGRYWLPSLWRKRIWISRPVAIHPMIVLDRTPREGWNWERIFPRDTTPKPPSEQTQWGDWLRFINGTVIQGQLIVRTPWKPSATLGKAAQDSAIRQALRGGGRLMIRRVPGGYQKIIQLDSVTAAVPLLWLSEPGLKHRLLEVSSLHMIAYPFRPPPAIVRDVKGVFAFTNDSAWWKGVYAALPKSRATVDGSYTFTSGDMTISLKSDRVSFADMRWVYPRLPSNGRGRLNLDFIWRGAMQDYQVSKADVRMGEAHVLGDFGLKLADTLTIHNTRLRFSGVDTRTLEQLIPGFRSPRRGVLAGRATVAGGRHALSLDTDLTFDDTRAGRSRVIAVGDIAFPGAGVRATNLRVQMLPLQIAMARTWYPNLPIDGIVLGRATINGNTASELRIRADIEHHDRGARSVLDGNATLKLASSGRIQWFDVDVMTRPVSLVEVGRFFPSAGLYGAVSGPVRLTGTFNALAVSGTLTLPDGGRFSARGTLDLASRELGYNIAAGLYRVNLRTITTKTPTTLLTGQAAANGRGVQLATMRASLAADLSMPQIDSVTVDTLSFRGSIADALADIKTLHAEGDNVTANVTGTFGLARNRNGRITYAIHIDSLGAFNRWIPSTFGSSTPVQPRPGLMARALRQARADSARIDRATEMERLLRGGEPPPPAVAVSAPQPVPGDTLTGVVNATGTIAGNIYDFDLRGRANGERVVARGNFVRRFKSEYAWVDARSPTSKLAIAVDADSLSAMGFAFDSAMVRFSYEQPKRDGRVEVVVVQDRHREYSAKGDYTLTRDRGELQLANMTFRFDTAFWSMPHPALVQWGPPGVRITDFELRNRNSGRIYADGLLPTEGNADLQVDIDDFPIGNIVDIAQTDFAMSGVLVLHGTMRGTLRSPAFQGAFGIVNASYNETEAPDVRGRFSYVDSVLVAHVDALSKRGKIITKIDGRVPINLAITGVTGDRILPLSMVVDAEADSLPLELVPHFTDLVTNLHGHAAGKVAVRGTLRQPVLVGGLVMERGSMTITATGANIDSVNASVRMANDTVYVDSVTARAKGTMRLRGTIAVGNWRDPALNLYLVSDAAELLNNKYGKVRVNAGVSLKGTFHEPYISGDMAITQGVIYAPEPEGRHVIGAGDPALFNVLDTTKAANRELFPPPSPFVSNLRVEVTVSISHNTWVRNREANIEVYTDDPLFIRIEQQSFAVTGVITTDRGEYNFLSKRFQIKRGSAIFIGGAEINPTLQITGEYQVQTASRGAINIRVQIGGTMRAPRLSLESDAQPPKTQSELLSLLAFGQSTTNVLVTGASSIAGSAATADLFGVGAQVAVRRLAGVALGVAVDQVEMQAGRAFGTDVFDITPADVPSGNVLLNFFQQTKFEAGKYINPRTFVSAQFQANQPGMSIDHRSGGGWHFNVAFEPRLLLREPRLNEQPVRTVRSYGGFIVREWRF